MSQDDDELDTVLPELSEADEAYVRDLLASLPPVPVPDDLAARLEAALRAEADQGGTASGAPPATATVVPLDSRRAARASRSTRVLQVAAAGLIVVAGGLGVVKLANHGNGSTATSAGAGAAVPAVEQAVVTHSGHTYSDQTLVADVRSLATRREPTELTPTADGTNSTSGFPSPQSTAGGDTATTSPSPKSGGPTFFIFGTASTPTPALVACLAAVEEGLPEPVTPLALDQGSYRGQAALVVVLPGSQDPKATYDVFVVGVGCGVDANAHLLTYQLVEAH